MEKRGVIFEAHLTRGKKVQPSNAKDFRLDRPGSNPVHMTASNAKYLGSDCHSRTVSLRNSVAAAQLIFAFYVV